MNSDTFVDKYSVLQFLEEILLQTYLSTGKTFK